MSSGGDPVIIFGGLGLVAAGALLWRERQKRLATQAQLSEAEEQHQRFSDRSTDLVFTLDTDLRMTGANQALEKSLGWSREELLGKTIADICPPGSVEEWQAFLNRLRKEKRGDADDLKLRHKNGQPVLVRLSAWCHRVDSSVILECVARDETAQRQNAFRQETLLELGRKLNAATSFTAAVETIVEVAGLLIGWDACVVRSINDAEGKGRVLVRIDTVNDRLVRFPCEEHYTPTPPFTQEILRRGGCVILRGNDGSGLPPTQFFGTERTSQSIVATPIKSGVKPVGVIALHSYTPQAYTSESLRLLQSLADYCGGAFTRIRIQEELEESARLLEERVESRTQELSAANTKLQLEVTERRRAEQVLRETQEQLERRVEERTSELSQANGELKREAIRHQRTSEALQQSEARFRRIFEAAPVGIAVSRHGMIHYVNQKHLEMFGYDEPYQMVGRIFLDLIAPQCREEVRERVLKRYEAGGDRDSYETVGVHRDGTQFFYQVEVTLIELEDGPATLAFLIDTTARRQAEEALRQSEQRFSRAFHASPLAIGIVALGSGRFIDVNEMFCHLFGYGHEEALGRTALELGIWQNPEDRSVFLAEVQLQGRVTGRECLFRSKHGRNIVASVSGEPIELGGQPCLLFLTHDLTDRVSLETQLRHAQKMEAVGQLAAGVAHDFNNIMTIIQGHTALLQGELAAAATATDSLHEIMTAAERAAGLTRQLLAFSRKQVMQPRLLDLNELLRNFTRMLNRLIGEHITLELHFEADLPFVRADAGMIEQVIMNLAVNARDAMPHGGQLAIRTQPVMTHRREAGQVVVGPESRFVRLTVSDNGCGMESSTLEHLFEPFFTTKEVGMGSGLGLATVYGIVQQHHGWIEVESELGQGSRFQIFFPVAEGEADELPGANASGAPRPGTGTVLVAEDEPGLLELVRHMLHRHGYRVLAAPSGDDAWLLWETHREEVDLLLTDMVMPGSLSGKALAERILAEEPELPVIYSSGYSVEMVREGLVLREGVNFLPKPYAPAVLMKLVEKCLKQRSVTADETMGDI